MPPLNDSAPVRPLIKDGVVLEDHWVSLSADDDLDAALAAQPADAAILVPLAVWQSLREALVARLAASGARLGVQLAPADDPGVLAADLDKLALVAVEFPAFTDGRGYSIGRLLRERYAFAGELRAVGDVQRDQLFAMSRCGFNAFVLRADKNPQDALASLKDFSLSYQTALDQKSPLFRRRAEVLAQLTAAA